MDKAVLAINKIYPVLFADEFQLLESNYLESAVFDERLYKMRKQILNAALRHDSTRGKPATRQALEDLTTFKPFNIRETNWEVWDVRESKNEQYVNLH